MKSEEEIYAFPLRSHSLGMTLRDYFAAQALEGIVSESPSYRNNPNIAAKLAYDLADAMIEARKTKV